MNLVCSSWLFIAGLVIVIIAVLSTPLIICVSIVVLVVVVMVHKIVSFLLAEICHLSSPLIYRNIITNHHWSEKVNHVFKIISSSLTAF